VHAPRRRARKKDCDGESNAPEATKPASYNFLQQQHRFDDFMQVYNTERPHQALGGRYVPSPKIFAANRFLIECECERWRIVGRCNQPSFRERGLETPE
jgi:hypothetical protein